MPRLTTRQTVETTFEGQTVTVSIEVAEPQRLSHYDPDRDAKTGRLQGQILVGVYAGLASANVESDRGRYPLAWREVVE